MMFKYARWLASAALVALTILPPLRAADPPKVRVESVRRVFHNGEHNAFTDLIRFKGRYYLTFRSCPDGHMVFPTSSIIVLSSEDGQDWKQVKRFSVPNRDTRDPHFLAYDDKLFVYTGTWYCGGTMEDRREINLHLGYGVWTADGEQWDGPNMLEGTYGHYIWRAAAYGGKAYLCGRRKREFVATSSREQRDPLIESALLESVDGLTWRTAGLFQEQYGDETSFLFEDDGAVLAVARSGGGRNAQVLRSKAPFDEWDRKDLGRYIGGPHVAKWGYRYFVGGRKIVDGKPSTTLSWLVGSELVDFAELPSAGDNSYPGFLELSPTRALVSYYSTHEKNAAGEPITAIYLAELMIAED